MSRKKRILFCGEASYLSTGFSTYALEVLKRLHATDKYDLMEYASYARYGDERMEGIPWKFKSAMFDPNKPGEEEAYHAHQFSVFGQWKFEEACLDHAPDIVCDIRDNWMMNYQAHSPFRPFYNLVWMPTCDAVPQDESWIADYLLADGIFGYTDWAIDTLKAQSRGQLKTLFSAPPGADFETYQVHPDKRSHKQKMGMDPDSLIVGTVMRNQLRKRYPEFLEAFAKYLETAPRDLAKKTFLYLHTSWPDVGWNIPRLLKETGLGHKTLFTYACRNCGANYPSFFQDARTVCKACGKMAATFPNSTVGVSRQTLSEVIGLFDVYVQYANSEGFGMPMVEAAACGVPVMATDYSAMEDVVRKLKGIPIKPKAFYREIETHCKRAIPDEDDFVEKLISFLSLPEAVRSKKGYEARQACEAHYDWDQTAKRWGDYFDSVETQPENQTWLSKPRYHEIATSIPQISSNEDFVRWAMVHVAGRPDLSNSHLALKLTRDLNWNATLGYGVGGVYFNDASVLGQKERFSEFGRDQALNILASIADKQNTWEALRAKRFNLS